MSFLDAGNRLIDNLTVALYDEAKDIMRDSLVECPISGPETYGGYYRTIRGERVRFDEPIYLEGDNGVLRRSNRVFAPVRTPDEVSVTIGYGFGSEVNPQGRIAAEYAVIVHERAEARHDPPTKDHYLSDPVLAHEASFAASIAARVAVGDLAGAALEDVSVEVTGE